MYRYFYTTKIHGDEIYTNKKLFKFYSKKDIENILSKECEDEYFHYPDHINLCQKCKLSLFIWYMKKKIG